jgi:Adenylate and Guanylate cyclase catalytic domain
MPCAQTVNTAARMESTGGRNQIHCSQETAALIEAAGKSWTFPREDKVNAKGKGQLQTYWVEFGSRNTASFRTGTSTISSSDDYSMGSADGISVYDCPGILHTETNSVRKIQETDKLRRLVEWNTDVFCRLLKQVVKRNIAAQKTQNITGLHRPFKDLVGQQMGNAVVDEVVDVIQLPEVVEHVSLQGDEVVLDATLVRQVHSYVKAISTMYRDNAFHNFEHVRAFQNFVLDRARNLTLMVLSPGLACNHERNQVALANCCTFRYPPE